MEDLKKTLLKEAQKAFKSASTYDEDTRIEVYYEEGKIKSDRLSDMETLVYNDSRILCYQVYGNRQLEEEIVVWIDMARKEEQKEGMGEIVQELVEAISKARGIAKESVSSYEVFANLPLSMISEIEEKILNYWWDTSDAENAKALALTQIDEALEAIAG
jgi:hypothetical protein